MRMNVTALDFNVRAKPSQPLDVLINRPVADDTAARHRNFAIVQPRQQRTEQADGSAHFADEIVRRDADWFFGASFNYAAGPVMPDLDAKPFQ